MDDTKIQVIVELPNGNVYSKHIQINKDVPNTEFVYVLTKTFEKIAREIDELNEER